MKCVFEGMGAVEKGVEVLALGLALCELCFEGMGAVEKGVWGAGIA